MSNNYDVTITKGALLHEESTILLQCFKKCGNWKDTREEVVNQNLFHKESKQTITTLYGLLKKRLQNLTPQEIVTYPTLPVQQQKFILWLACCRTHRILSDFCIEVLQPLLATKETSITSTHFRTFYQNKSAQITKLSFLTLKTQAQIKNRTFTMLRQVGILDKYNIIHFTTLAPEVVALIKEHNPEEFLWFALANLLNTPASPNTTPPKNSHPAKRNQKKERK